MLFHSFFAIGGDPMTENERQGGKLTHAIYIIWQERNYFPTICITLNHSRAK